MFPLCFNDHWAITVAPSWPHSLNLKVNRSRVTVKKMFCCHSPTLKDGHRIERGHQGSGYGQLKIYTNMKMDGGGPRVQPNVHDHIHIRITEKNIFRLLIDPAAPPKCRIESHEVQSCIYN